MAAWIDQIMKNPRRVAMPIMTHPGIEYIGKHVVDAVTNGEVHFEAIKAVVEKYDMAACTVIMDLTVEAEAFGCQIEFPEDDMPHVVNRLVCDEASVQALQVPDLTQGRVPEYLRPISWRLLILRIVRSSPAVSVRTHWQAVYTICRKL